MTKLSVTLNLFQGLNYTAKTNFLDILEQFFCCFVLVAFLAKVQSSFFDF